MRLRLLRVSSQVGKAKLTIAKTTQGQVVYFFLVDTVKDNSTKPTIL